MHGSTSVEGASFNRDRSCEQVTKNKIKITSSIRNEPEAAMNLRGNVFTYLLESSNYRFYKVLTKLGSLATVLLESIL